MNDFIQKFWVLFKYILKFVIYKLLKLNLSESNWDSFIQFVKFGIVGFSNTLLAYMLYAASLYFFKEFRLFPRCDYFAAQFIAFVLSVAWSFYWNNKFVFRQEEGEKRNIFAALAKTYVSYAFTSLFLSEFFLFIWVDISGISEYIAPILTLLVTVPLNFIIQKLWAFKVSVSRDK